MIEITERQKDVLKFIIKYKQENGFSPTFRDIESGMNINVKAARDHVVALRNKNYLKFSENKSRSIVVLKMPEGI